MEVIEYRKRTVMDFTTELEDFTGKLLVATPNTSPNSYFAKTVIYIVKYSQEEGTIGLIVNQPLPLNNSPALTKHKTTNLNVDNLHLNNLETYIGGPVDVDKGFLLHSDLACSTETNSIYLTSNIKLLKNIATGKGPKHSMFLFGYCGWGNGQLEAEIKNNEWLLLPEDKGIIFETSNMEKWSRAIGQLKINPIRYINKPGNC
jgi:putative transcriptional regulator